MTVKHEQQTDIRCSSVCESTKYNGNQDAVSLQYMLTPKPDAAIKDFLNNAKLNISRQINTKFLDSIKDKNIDDISVPYTYSNNKYTYYFIIFRLST